MAKGKIIVIEGTDGSGKQVQSKLLYDRLISEGKNVVLQSFPNYESSSSGPVKLYLAPPSPNSFPSSIQLWKKREA